MGLLTPQAGYPAINLRELVPQGQDLSKCAAQIRIVIPQLRAIRICLLLNRLLWLNRFDLHTEEVLKRSLQGHGLRKKQAGV